MKTNKAKTLPTYSESRGGLFLWEVATNRTGDGNLWITTEKRSMEAASRAARRFLVKEGRTHERITMIKARGTLDA